MTLTGKQKRALKALGQKIPDDLRVGAEGLSEGFVAALSRVLDRKEVAKVRFTDLEGDDRKSFALEIAEAAGAVCVATVGRTVLLYRANPELDPGKRALPPG